MKIGFTGTRDGISAGQEEALFGFIEQLASFTFHHGCCIGADADAALAVSDHPGAVIVGHPPLIRTMISDQAVRLCRETMRPFPYLERNRQIVDGCNVLLACPKGPEEQRSGTWSTVRYARKKGKRVVIFWPDGKVTEEGGT